MFLIFCSALRNAYAQKVRFSIDSAEGKSKLGFFSHDGVQLFLHTTGGLFYLNGEDWLNASELIQGQLSSKHIRSIIQDKRGNFWLGFGNNSLQQIRNGVLVNFEPKSDDDQLLIRGSVNQITAFANDMLLVSDYGLFLMDLDMNIIKRFSFSETYPTVVHSFNTSDLMRCIMQDQNKTTDFWIGGTMGLAKFDMLSEQWTHIPMPSSLIQNALEPKFTTKDYNNLMVTDILQIDKKLFCATWGNGIMTYNLETKSWQTHHFQKITPLVPLDENIVSRLCQINDSMLVATTQGYKSPLVFDFKNSSYIGFQEYFNIEPAFDYSDGVALFGSNLWIGYFNAVEKYDVSQFINAKIDDYQLIPKINKISVDGVNLEQRALFQNIEFNRRVESSGKEIEIIFSLPINSAAFLEYAWGDTTKIQVSKNSTISSTLNAGEQVLYYRIQGADFWQNIRVYRASFWYEKPLFYMLASVIVLLIFITVISFRNRKRAEVKQQKLELENRILQLERKALQAQINPHFIFNCLVSIKSLIVNKDKKVATDFVNEFAAFIRQVLNFTNIDAVTALEEIEILRKYVQIESTRFGQELHFVIENVDNIDLNEVNLPPLVLQPFVENAIWHGLIPKKTVGQICIRFTKQKKRILIEILDDGVGLNPNKTNKKAQQSLGISITKNRLNNFYRCEIDCVIEARSDMPGTVVKVWIPNNNEDE